MNALRAGLGQHNFLGLVISTRFSQFIESGRVKIITDYILTGSGYLESGKNLTQPYMLRLLSSTKALLYLDG